MGERSLIKGIIMKHSVENVVTQTMAYLECSYFLVFTLALAYNQMPYSRKIVEKELERWHKRDIIPEWLGDFCLDVLAKRITININSKDFRVEKVWRKNEPKRLESGSG